MPIWNYKIKLKHLFTEDESYEAVQNSMTAVADVVAKHPAFNGFSVVKFRSIPHGDDTFGPVDYANRLLARLYDFADDKRIWIE